MATAQSIAGVAHAKVLEASKAIADAEKEVTVKAEAENIAAGAPKALQVSHGVGRRHAPNIVASEGGAGGGGEKSAKAQSLRGVQGTYSSAVSSLAGGSLEVAGCSTCGSSRGTGSRRMMVSASSEDDAYGGTTFS